MEAERPISTACWYNRKIDCEDMTKCKTCGWNPKNVNLRKQRIEKLKERMAAK